MSNIGRSLAIFALVGPPLLWTCAALADASLEKQVQCAEIQFSQAAETRNPDLFRAKIDADARFVGSSVLRGPDQILDAWEPYFVEDGPSIKWRPQFVEVLEDGEIALTRGPYRIETTNKEGAQVVFWGTFTSVWRLAPTNEWRVVFDAGGAPNEDPPADALAILDQTVDCSNI